MSHLSASGKALQYEQEVTTWLIPPALFRIREGEDLSKLRRLAVLSPGVITPDDDIEVAPDSIIYLLLGDAAPFHDYESLVDTEDYNFARSSNTVG